MFTTEQQNQILQETIALMRAESAAKIAAIQGAAVLSSNAATQGEIPLQVLEVSSLLPGVPRSYLSSILDGKFDPYNLHKLGPLQGDEEADKQQVFALLENGIFQMQKAKGKLKDYGAHSQIWADGFLSYHIAMTFYFGRTHPTLPSALSVFMQRILRLETIYVWDKAVLPLALAHHSTW